MSTRAALRSRSDLPAPPQRAARPRFQRARALRRPVTLGLCVFAAGLPLVPALLAGANLQSYVGALFALGLLAVALRRDPKLCAAPFVPSEAGIGVLLLLAAAMVSAAVHLVPASTVFGVLPLLALGATWVVARIALRTELDHARLAGFLAVTLAVLCACALVGFVGFVAARRDGLVTESARSDWLSTPFYPHSYIVAQVALPITPFVLSYLLTPTSASKRLLYVLALVLAATFFFFTLSRATWLAFLVSTCVVVFAATRRRAKSEDRRDPKLTHPKRRGVVAATAALAIVLVTCVPTPAWLNPITTSVRDRVVSLIDPTAAPFNFSRIQVWSDSLRLLADHQPFGVGPGRFATEFGHYDEGRRFIPHAHNQYLHTLAEFGVAGLLGLCFLLFGSIALARRTLRNSEPKNLAAVRGALGGLVALAIICVFEAPLLHVPCLVVLAIYSAIAIESALRNGITPAIPWTLTGPAIVRIDRTTRVATIFATIVVSIAMALHGGAAIRGTHAREHFESGRFDEAADLSARATGLQPQLDWLWWLDAQIHHSRGDFGLAERSYARHASLLPRFPAVSIRRAEALSRLHRHQDALSLLLDARDHAPPEMRLDIDYHLANSFAWLGRDEEARVLYLSLLERHADARFVELRDRVVQCLVRLNRDRRLVSVLRAR